MKSNLVKILGTLGLIIAIAIILKSVFGIGNIGFKSILNKVSSSKSLPILKCEIYDTDGSKRIEFYDLEKIKKNDPTQRMTTDQYQKWRKQKNLETTTFGDNESMNEYTIKYRNHENGVVKGYSIEIKKDTGELKLRFPKHYPVEATFSKVLDAIAEGQVFKGECVEVKRKNL